MNAVTPLARAVLDLLDTCERGTGDTELGAAIYRRCGNFYDACELTEALLAMIDAGLILSRFAEWPLDHAVTADPILYEITEAGCAARWALLKAEAQPGIFEGRCAPNAWHMSNGSAVVVSPTNGETLNGSRHAPAIVIDAPLYARPVSFASREVFIYFCRGARA